MEVVRRRRQPGAATEEDESKGRAEYLAEFRRDVEGFVDREVVEAVTIP